MPYKKNLLGFLCAITVAAMSSVAYAETVYVSANAGSKGNGSARSPFNTIDMGAYEN